MTLSIVTANAQSHDVLQLSDMVAVAKYLPVPKSMNWVSSPLPIIVTFAGGTGVGVGKGVGLGVGTGVGAGKGEGVGTGVGDGVGASVGTIMMVDPEVGFGVNVGGVVGVAVGSEAGLGAMVGVESGMSTGSVWLQATATIAAMQTNIAAIHAPLETSAHLYILVTPLTLN